MASGADLIMAESDSIRPQTDPVRVINLPISENRAALNITLRTLNNQPRRLLSQFGAVGSIASGRAC